MIVGFLVLANGATIIAVMGSAMKISSKFGSMETKIENNSTNIRRVEVRVHSIERSI